jgi:hypothetical protein
VTLEKRDAARLRVGVELVGALVELLGLCPRSRGGELLLLRGELLAASSSGAFFGLGRRTLTFELTHLRQVALLLRFPAVLGADRFAVATRQRDGNDRGHDHDGDEGNDDGCVHALRLPNGPPPETVHTFPYCPERAGSPPKTIPSYRRCTNVLLWLLAVIIAIVGVVQLFQGQLLLGIALLVLACLVGPGGYSMFRSNRT